MGIQAKRESLFRIIGMIQILISFTISIFFDFFVLNSPLMYFLLILIVLSYMILSIFLKLEINFFVGNFLKILVILCIFSMCLIFVGIFFCSNYPTFLKFIFLVISNILIILCWHFSLSLYKNEKLIFFFCGIGYILLSLIFGVKILIIKIGGYALIPLILLPLGISFIMISEMNMKKKGLLKYI